MLGPTSNCFWSFPNNHAHIPRSDSKLENYPKLSLTPQVNSCSRRRVFPQFGNTRLARLEWSSAVAANVQAAHWALRFSQVQSKMAACFFGMQEASCDSIIQRMLLAKGQPPYKAQHRHLEPPKSGCLNIGQPPKALSFGFPFNHAEKRTLDTRNHSSELVAVSPRRLAAAVESTPLGCLRKVS